MKDKVIETAGKTWRLLGEKGEINIVDIPKLLKERGEIVYQALGWLAREDKVNYITKNKGAFVSLVESELASFKNTIQNIQAQQRSTNSQSQTAKRAARRI